MRQVTTGNQTVEAMSVSFDGKWIAYDSNINGNQDIFKVSTGGGEPEQLTHNGADNFTPSWSPDSREIAYHSLVNGNRDVFVMDASGGKVTQVTSAPREELAPLWVGPNTLAFQVNPDSTYTVTRTAGKWSTAKYIARAQVGTAIETAGGWKLILLAGDNTICATCPAGPYLTNPDASNPVRLELPQISKRAALGGTIAVGPTTDVFASFGERDGSTAIWSLPFNGKTEQQLYRFTDPARSLFRAMFIGMDSTQVYFILGNIQSDIWSIQLKKQ
jgi:Tol biopolymer transport system component